MQFAPSFLSLPVTSISMLEQQGIEFVGGAYCGTSRFHEWLVNQPECSGKPIFYPDLEELEWTQQPLERSELERIRATYGDEVIHRIIIGERHVGFGYVSGAKITKTPLTMAIDRGGNEAVWQYVVSLVCRIEQILDQTKPDVIFQYAVAGAVGLAIQFVAQERRIPTVCFVHTRIGHELAIAPAQGSGDDGPVIRQMTANANSESISRARAYIDEFREKPRHPGYTSFTAQRLKRQRSAKGFATGIAKMGSGLLSKSNDTPHSSRLFNGLNDLSSPLKNRSQERLMRKLSKPFEDFEHRPYAFYPMHVDPEASTMVLAPEHTDQAHVIQRIAQSLPVGMPLLVKEHIPMVGKRPRGFYERICRMPGVALISAGSEPYQLIKNASIVISITGTACLEATILQRPALIMGNAYFQHMESGITRLRDHDTMHDAIRSALESAPASDDYLERFIGGMLAHSACIPSDTLWSKRAQGERDSMSSAAVLFANLLAKTCQRHAGEQPNST